MRAETLESSARLAGSGSVVRLLTPPPAEAGPARRAGGKLRLLLTRSAPRLFRVHLARDLFRIAVLATADAAVLLSVWLGIQAAARTADLGAGVVAGVSTGQFVVAVLVTLALFGCYGPGEERRNSAAIVRAAGIGSALALWERLWTPEAIAALPALLVLWLAAAVGLTLERKLVDWIVRLVRPAGGRIMRAAVVGGSDHAARLIDHPAFGETPWCHLAAFFDPQRYPTDPASALSRLISERRIDTLILTGRLDGEAFETALDVAAASGCQVFSLPRVTPTSMVLPKVLWRNGSPIVELTRPGLMGAKLYVKRGIDIVGSALLLLLAAPVMSLVALALRLTGKGPVLFRQTRIGQGGRTFTILKFRTMVEGAEGQAAGLRQQSLYGDGRLFKVVNDPRVTRLGAMLRRTSLDELPQLWNVLRGDMSLVGPRPPLPGEVELYEGHHYARFDVKPGLTGPWQVSGRNSIDDFEEVIHLETAYIRRWSIWRDLALLLRTVPAVLSRRGAL